MRRLTAALMSVPVLWIGCDGDPAPVDSGPPPVDAGPSACEQPPPALATEPVVPGHFWNSPLYVTQPPGDDALYVVEQGGRILAVRGTEVTTFLDLSGRVNVGGERGLLGLAFHPDYATNGRLFVYYTPISPTTNRVAEYRRSTADPTVADPAEVAVLVDIDDPESNHNGGMVAFGPDGFLYVGTGDGGGAGDRHGAIGNALDLQVALGKLLRLDVDAAAGGYAAAGNPFADGSGLPQIWAYGLRNPWRFSFDRTTGELYIGDVGQNRVEEIDHAPAGVAGLNYGWRAYEGFDVFSASEIALVPEHAAPIFTFEHEGGSVLGSACSVTGGYVYRGAAIPGLRGTYLFGDWCSPRRAALRRCEGGVEVVDLPGLEGTPNNLTSFGEDQAGELYMTGTGAVLRIIAG